MQNTEASQAATRTVEIIKVRPPNLVQFSFYCDRCGQCEARLNLALLVPRRKLMAFIQLAIDAHLRAH